MVPFSVLYCPMPSWPLWWIRFFSSTALSALTSIAPTAWFQRMSLAYTFQPSPSWIAPPCGGVAKCSIVRPRTVTPFALDWIAVSVFDISTDRPAGLSPR